MIEPLSPGFAPPVRAAFSVDVEDYFQVESLRAFCPRERWTEFEDRTEENTDRILGILDQLGGRGTFFVLGWVAERHPALVRRIAAAGHEVASHGFNHELLYHQTPQEFREDVRRSRLLLQDLTGQPVLGYRAPSYTVVQSTRWALEVLREEGYRYDSSIFPIKRLRYGMPGAPRWPHMTQAGPQKQIAEFPLPTVRVGVLNVPATGGAYLRLLPFSFQKWSLGRMIRHRQAFVLNVHPWELDPDQPRFPVSMRTRWTHYHNLDRAESRLRTLLCLTSFHPLQDVLTDLQLLGLEKDSTVG